MSETFDMACRTLVIGLGKTGLSVARFLAQRGVQVAIVDSRENPPGLAQLRAELPHDVALFLGGFRHEAFERAEQIVISPGVSSAHAEIAAAAARGVPLLGDIELFARTATAPVIAVTGSNGKSTVVTLLSAMARRAGMDVRTGGNIGTPALDLIQEQEPDLYVLELSSFQLETTRSLHAQAAVVLNISADHLDRYPDLDAYAAAKQVIYRAAGCQVVNADDPLAAALADPARRQIRFSRQQPGGDDYGLIDVDGAPWLARGTHALMPASAIRMAGRHNVSNALAALALGEAAGLPQDAMLATLTEFKGLPHRMQPVAEHGGVHWFNDSKGTNVGATLAAIDSVDGKVVLIAGGDGKGADFNPLAAALQEKGRAAVLIGKDAPQIAAVLADVVPVSHADDMAQAVALAAGLAQPGDCVLLSPACASTDMFSDFAARGEVFTECVRRYLA
ncbi:MAG: UDP-N-acetylmuramoyl-L-alanine--D-glutamate ligase [Gammaproteobacteria bacterium]